MTLLEVVKMYRGRIAAGIGTAVLVGAASAGTLNTTISPIMTDLATIFGGSFTDMIVGLIAPLIALTFLGFFTGLFDGIVGKIRM